MNWYKKAAYGFEWYGWLSPSGEFVKNKSSHISTEEDIRDRDYPEEQIVSEYDFLMGKGWLRLSGSNKIYAENNITKNVTWKQKQYLKNLAIENHTSVLFDNGSGRYIILFEGENNNYLVASKIVLAGDDTSWLSPDGKFYPNPPGTIHEEAAEGLRNQFYNNMDGSDSYEFLMRKGWIRVGNSMGYMSYENKSKLIGNNFITKSINQKQKAALIDLAIEMGKKTVELDNGTSKWIVLWQREEYDNKSIIASKKIFANNNTYSWLSPEGRFYPVQGNHGYTGGNIIKKLYSNEIRPGESIVDPYMFLMQKGWMRITYIGDTLYANNYAISQLNERQKREIRDLAIESGKRMARFDGSTDDYVIWSEADDNYVAASRKIYAKDMIVEKDNEFYDNYYNIGHGPMEVGDHPKKKCKSYIWAWDGQRVRDMIAGPDDAHSSTINGRWQGRAEFCPNQSPKVSLTSRMKFDQPSEDVIESLHRRYGDNIQIYHFE